MLFSFFKIEPDLFRDGFRIGLGHKTGHVVGYQGRQPAYIGHDHRNLKMIGEGCYAALRGIAVRLYHEVGCAEIILHIVIGDEFRVQEQVFFYTQLADQFLVGLPVFIKLAGDQ